MSTSIVDGFDNHLAAPSMRVKRANPDLMVDAPAAKKPMTEFFEVKKSTEFKNRYQAEVQVRQEQGQATCRASWNAYLECKKVLADMVQPGTSRIIGARAVLAIKDVTSIDHFNPGKPVVSTIHWHASKLYEAAMKDLANHFSVSLIDVEEHVLFVASEQKMPFDQVWAFAKEAFYAPDQDIWKLSMYHTSLLSMVTGFYKKTFCAELLPFLQDTLHLDVPECRKWYDAVANKIHSACHYIPTQHRKRKDGGYYSIESAYSTVRDFLDASIRGLYYYHSTRYEMRSEIVFDPTWLVWN